jgi:hypothetical protein
MSILSRMRQLYLCGTTRTTKPSKETKTNQKTGDWGHFLEALIIF